MRFRFRLALVFLLLSAFPLTLLALYSFTTSSGALRRAAEAEAKLMARELEQRVENVSADIDQSVRALARLPADYWLHSAGENGQAGAAGEARVDPQVFAGLAQALPFIEDFKFVPRARVGTSAVREAGRSARVTASGTTVRPAADQAAEQDARRLERSLRLAEESVAATLAHFPTGLSDAERQRVQEELAKVRAEIGRNFAERHELQAGSPPTPRPAPPVPPPAPSPLSAAAMAPLPAVAPVPAARPLAPGERALAQLTNGVSCPVRDDGEIVGELQGKLKAKEILRSVLAQTHRDQGEIPFAIDDENKLYVAAGSDGDTLQKLPAVAALRRDKSAASPAHDGGDDWVVVARKDPASGLRFGIARPISQAMKELRSATAFNFLAGFLLVGIATVGMIPLTGGMVRSVHQLAAGAARIAEGDLSTRVPVRSRDEFGRLAESFNHMAGQLAEHQTRLIEQERVHKEREIERRLLEAENGRKSLELEEARLFQLSLLPRQLPEYPGLELAVAMSTATEVGGDYYDFRRAENGDLLVAVGDATGHGAAAGTMVTVAKSLFMAAMSPLAPTPPIPQAIGQEGFSPAAFLRRSTGLVHSLGLSRMAMALAVVRVAGRALTIASAGMPPALHFRSRPGDVDEIALSGMPLGARADYVYAERRIDLAPGDVVLLMSDGFPELPNAAGEPLGYERARALFAAAARGNAGEIVAALERSAAEWSASGALDPIAATAPMTAPATPPAPSDDVTFLVLRAT